MSQNVRREYRQSFISGFEHIAQSRDENGNRKTDVVVESSAAIKKGQRMYNVSISLIIEQISNDSGQYIYRILLNDDPNISCTPLSTRSKKAIGQAASLPKKNIKGGDSFSMVYGIHKDGKCSLSHTSQHPIQRVAPQVYSFILGAIDRAIECTILLPEDEKGNDDTGERSKGTPTQKSLGENKKTRRGKKIRAEVLPETLPEEAPGMVEIDREVLGRRQANSEIRSNQLGSGTYIGGELADSLSDGQAPDIGF